MGPVHLSLHFCVVVQTRLRIAGQSWPKFDGFCTTFVPKGSYIPSKNLKSLGNSNEYACAQFDYQLNSLWICLLSNVPRIEHFL